MTDNFERFFRMLTYIPREPAYINVDEIVSRFERDGIFVSSRTVQRDIKSMYSFGFLGLVCNEQTKPYAWSFSRSWNRLNLELMDTHMALAMSTLKRFANELLPLDSRNQLQSYFDRADQVLSRDPDNPWLYWACRVAQLPTSTLYQLPPVNKQDLEALQLALIKHRQIQMEIKRFIGKKTYWVQYQKVNPLGIIVQDEMPHLLFTLGSFHTKRYYKPLTQLRNVEVTQLQSLDVEQLDLEKVVNYTKGDEIELELAFSQDALFILQEAKLSDDQTQTQLVDGRFHIRATVKDTKRLRAMLWGMGSGVEVLAPEGIRNHFKDKYQVLATRYQ